MKRVSFTIATIVACTIFTGCINNKVGWIEEGPDMEGSSGGVYAVGALPNSAISAKEMERVKDEFNLKTGAVDDQAVPSKDSALPIAIKVSGGATKDVTGSVASINNFLSVFTLGIWPHVKSEEKTCSVEIITPNGTTSQTYVLGSRTWSSFILPIAALPCPGWGCWRSSPYMTGGEDGLDEFERETQMGMAATLLTSDFYKAEMAKYVDSRQKKFDVKKKAIKKLQAVLDAE